jgi:TRAP-type transport system periplasmic protein
MEDEYMKRFSFLWALSLVAIVIAAVLAPHAGYGQQKVITLNYANIWPATHRNSINADLWAKKVEKRTNGRVKVTVFHGGTLTPMQLIYDNVVKGIADVGVSVFSYTRGKFPLMEVTDLPLGCKNAIVATQLVNEVYKKFKPRELDDVRIMYLHAHGPGLLHTTKKPVNKMEDLKGMRIRAAGTITRIVSYLGGAPVGMPMGDTYDALSRGVADGAFAPMEALEGWKWGEVVKYTTESYSIAYTNGMYVIMNKAKWNSLPPDIQNIIEKINEEWIVKQAKTWDEGDKSGKVFALKRGNQMITLSPEESERWAKAVKPMFTDYVKNSKDKGLPGEEALNFCLNYLKAHQ